MFTPTVKILNRSIASQHVWFGDRMRVFMGFCAWKYSDISDNIWDQKDVNVHAIIHSQCSICEFASFWLTEVKTGARFVFFRDSLNQTENDDAMEGKKDSVIKIKTTFNLQCRGYNILHKKPCWSCADRLPDANTTCFCKASKAVRWLAMALKTLQNLVGSFLLELLVVTDLLLGRSAVCLMGDPP